MKTEPAEVSFDLHPWADLFPLMCDEGLTLLSLSLQDKGQREPIVLSEGKILDGRNRFRGLKALNRPIETLNFEGDDPVSYVADHNLHRRHLKPSQRAAVAAWLSELLRADNLEESAESEDTADSALALTQAEAANQLGVSKRLVAAGSTIKIQGHPDLINLVKNGIMGIESAVLVSDLSMDSQEEILNNSPEDFRKAIKDVRDKNKLGKTRAGESSEPSSNSKRLGYNGTAAGSVSG
ncbi:MULTISPECIES: hypothetical protein [Pseudomonas]|uniref:ParB/Sulfiredoxin domain-containing protein n=1 Tax=Pseudomonas helleri TaxID=1608996 RepID=A0A7X2BW45_9PSED|nr:hypothetical protein [Pseudomonas helleri]MQT77289.1 hypothetical protein [Pseudomonas helleri]